MSVRGRNSGGLAHFGRRALSLLAIVSMLGVGAIGTVATSGTPAGAAGVAKDGLTAENAAPSCWSIKQNYPASADGIYWLRTPKLIAPEQFYCDQTTEGGGWVLIGRGREGWSFPYWGQGSPSTLRNTVTGPAAFAPDTLSTPMVDGLLNGARMDSLGDDGVRLRRATNTAGTTWQEVRMRIKTYGSWSWAFGGGIYLSSIKFDNTVTTLATSTYATNTTRNVQVSNDTRRVTTTPQSIHNNKASFDFGSNVTTGSNSATSYLWEYANENYAVPFTQVFVRPKITEADLVSQGVTIAPDTGIAKTEQRPMLDHRSTAQPWAVTGINAGTSIPSLGSYVLAFAQIGNTVYVGGKFLSVQHGPGGPTFTQSYLAAFDMDTGEWIPTFNPLINGPVWEIKAAPDGSKLFVGGEFTSVNGLANTTALAALDPATGAPVANWLGYVSRPTGTYDVRALDVQGPWLYAGGNFTRISGGIGTQFQGPITDSRMARFRLTDGKPDGTWKPSLDTAPQDIDASDNGDRVYAVGLFQTLNDVALNPTRLAIMDTVTGAAVPGLQPFQPNAPSSVEWQNTILEVGNKVYQGGSQHVLQQYNRSDYAFERSQMTKEGGDYQAMVSLDGILYAACHCGNWQFEDANTWVDPSGYSRVNPINFIGAYDETDNLEVMPEFHPTSLDITGSGGEGVWELFVDSNKCMWAGGDLIRQGTTPTPFYGGFQKFCERDSQAPATPPNARATVAGNDVTISWNASTDNSTDPIHYEVLKDDPTFGTIVMDSTFERNLTDTNVVGPTRYFVRAVDQEGNRSATTQVINVTPPPPAAATLLPAGSAWSYQANGNDLGTNWRNPAYDVSSWPTGPAELGWGDGDEATAIPSGTLTQYFVKHVNVSNPSQYKTITVRLKRDDGAAVYVNGVEAVRDNLPPGQLKATTPASGFASGPQETTFYEYQVPASLLVNGDNTIAVELHQPDAGNADASFDMEIVARNGSEANSPSAPAPTVSDVTSSTATVSWPASTDDTQVIGYAVRRNGSLVTFTTATSFPDFGLTPATAYSYDIRAIDSSGNSSVPGVVATTTTANQILVASGAVWSYQSGGADPGTAWRQNSFDASSWPTGPSQLGWGDGDEQTVIPSNTLTQYFIRHFNVDDPDPFQLLNVRLKRDDGAAVYINGVEVVRNNLPAGTLTSGTFATAAVSGAAENTWNEFSVPGALLVTGDNVITVEVHQNTNNNVDSTMDLELVRQTPNETNPPTRPSLSLTSAEESTLTFGWSASTDDSGLFGYLVQRDGATVGFTTGTTFTDTGLLPSTAYSYQVVAIDTSGNASTPGSLAASTTVNPYLVNFGAGWDYRFDGVDQGTAWKESAFDSGSWASGPSELGIGDADEATVIGPTTTPTPVTAYFRHTFQVDDTASIAALTMDVVRDDGFVVYVNGVEVGRNNMPAGPISYATRPVAGISVRSDETTPVTLSIPPSALQVGDNVIAVEMHQANSTSNDLSFNLRLRATYVVVPVVTVTSPQADSIHNSPSTTFGGLCTTSAGTVTANVGGTQSMILTAPCVDNEWTTSTPLPDGSYDVIASQTAGVTGSSSSVQFFVDSVAPVVTLDAPTAGQLLPAAQTFSGSCTQGEGGVTITITGTAGSVLTTPCNAGTFSTAGALGTGAFSATASQTDAATNTGSSAPVSFGVDATAPVTTDDTAAIGNGWKSVSQTVTLSATDAGGAGVGQTYFTTDGNNPTTSSPTGTSVPLTTDGVYTVKYFTVDALGNAEAVKTAGTQIRIDTQAPSTTDNSSSFVNWTNQNVTVTLTPADTGSGAATTYSTTNGTTPTTASTQGTSVLLSAAGTYTIKYFSVDAAGNTEGVKTAGTPIRIDKTAPVTTDNTASIGNGWKNTTQTVTLSPTDSGGAGVATTYYTTDGSVPTTASAQGTSVVLSTSGTYTVRYFSVDLAGNAEAVKTAGMQIRVDMTAPTNTITFPVNGGRYNSTSWSGGGCSAGSSRICGTASDIGGSGISTTRVSVQRGSDNRWWNGSTWQTTQTSVTTSSSSPWSTSLSTSQLSNGVVYTVTAWTLDTAGNQSPNSVSVFTYDTSSPTTAAANLVTTNKNGTVQVGDTFAVTFNEAMKASTVPATGTLSLSRSNGNTSWGITGLSEGNFTTGSTNYLSSSGSTRTITFAGSLALSNNNQTITFTVTGACSGSACSSQTSTTNNGAFQFEPENNLQDVAGNGVSTSTITAASTVMF